MIVTKTKTYPFEETHSHIRAIIKELIYDCYADCSLDSLHNIVEAAESNREQCIDYCGNSYFIKYWFWHYSTRYLALRNAVCSKYVTDPKWQVKIDTSLLLMKGEV